MFPTENSFSGDADGSSAGAISRMHPGNHRRFPMRKLAEDEQGLVATLDFLFSMLWTIVILFFFIQIALVGFTWQVTGYATYAAGRSRMVGALFNRDYADVAKNVMKRSLPAKWGNTFIVQELPLVGVFILYWKKIFGFIPIPVFGRSAIPYSQVNPLNPDLHSWYLGDNDG